MGDGCAAFLFSFDVKAMEKPMGKRRDQNRRDPDESESREKRVEGSEEFCSGGVEWINRAHAAQNHRCVQKRIDPAQTRDEMVSKNANS